MIEKPIRNTTELESLLNTLKEETHCDTLTTVYRGQAKLQWKLQPSAYRSDILEERDQRFKASIGQNPDTSWFYDQELLKALVWLRSFKSTLLAKDSI